MVNRIQSILRHYNMAPSKFADILEVPRSTISHILSERNKPSLEFIQKVMEKFPEIETEWLIKGEGQMLGKELNLFSSQPTGHGEISRSETHKNTDNVPENLIIPGRSKEEEIHEILKDESLDKKPHKLFDYQPAAPSKKEVSEGKKLVKIIMIYDDHTFIQLLPA
jgi:transcriptional regulator with XRE-family HTH domain